MGFLSWLLGGEANPPKRPQQVLPCWDNGWRDDPRHQFTSMMRPLADGEYPVAHPEDTEPYQMQLDLQEYPQEHHEQNKAS